MLAQTGAQHAAPATLRRAACILRTLSSLRSAGWSQAGKGIASISLSSCSSSVSCRHGEAPLGDEMRS